MKKIFLILATLLGVTSYSQVAIGTINPNPSSILDLLSTEKGLLLPRVALNKISLFSPLLSQLGGMVVYNTVTTGDVTPGFYYNDGQKWIRISSTNGKTVVNGTINPLTTNENDGDFCI